MSQLVDYWGRCVTHFQPSYQNPYDAIHNDIASLLAVLELLL